MLRLVTAIAKLVLSFPYTHLFSPVGLLLMCVSATSAMVRNALDFNLPQSLITAGRASPDFYITENRNLGIANNAVFLYNLL